MGDNGEGTEGDTPHGTEGHDCQTKESTIEDITKKTGTSSTLTDNLKEESTDIEQSEDLEKADRLQDIHLDENKQDAVIREMSPRHKGLRSRFLGKGRGNQKRADTETKTEEKGEKGAPIQADKRRNPSRVVTCIYACCCVAPVE